MRKKSRVVFFINVNTDIDFSKVKPLTYTPIIFIFVLTNK